MSLRRLVAAVALAVWPGVASAALVDRVAAVVDDDVITLGEVYALGADFIEQSSGEGGPVGRRTAELEVLDELVTRVLVASELRRLSMDVTEEEVERSIDDIARQNGLDRERLRAEVEKSGLPWSEYRDELRENVRQLKFTEAVIKPRISVVDDELLDAWRRTYAGADRPQVVELGAFFLAYPPGADDAAKQAVRERAAASIAQVRGGSAFTEVATAVDEGPYGAQGGRMGTFKKGELRALLDVPAFTLPVAGTSDPIDTAQGVFVLHVFARLAQDAPPFEEVREQLMGQVYGARIEDELEQWARQARSRAAIVIKLEPAEGP